MHVSPLGMKPAGQMGVLNTPVWPSQPRRSTPGGHVIGSGGASAGRDVGRAPGSIDVLLATTGESRGSW